VEGPPPPAIPDRHACPETWAALRVPAPWRRPHTARGRGYRSRRLSDRLARLRDTRWRRGPCPVPRPRPGNLAPGRARWLGQAGGWVPGVGANRYGRLARPPLQDTAGVMRGAGQGARTEEMAGTHLSLGRGPAARPPRRLFRGPRGGGGAQWRRRAGSAQPGAHAPRRQQQPRPRAAGILATATAAAATATAAGSQGAPGPFPTRAPRHPGQRVAPGRLAARSGRDPDSLSLSSAPVWGRAPRTPRTARSSTPPAPAPAGRAGSAHVRGCLAAPRSPVAEAPPELRALETPCSSGLLPSQLRPGAWWPPHRAIATPPPLPPAALRVGDPHPHASPMAPRFPGSAT
jgi:hypothetical protein